MPLDVRRNFHHELDLLQEDIVRMAGMVTESLAQATQAFLDGDLAAADEIQSGDDIIDTMALEAEERCYQLLALQQPMASDLRALTTAIRLIAEIERSGDLVVNIMKAARRIYGTEIDPRTRGLIERLGDQVHRLFRLSIDAYVDRNVGLAAALDDMDDAVDELHVDFISSIFETRESGELPLQVAVQLALVGRFYERIGDHAVNIGERVRYMVTGWLPEHTGAARQAARKAQAEGQEPEPVLDDGEGDE
jgi:phosphate transport system protein